MFYDIWYIKVHTYKIYVKAVWIDNCRFSIRILCSAFPSLFLSSLELDLYPIFQIEFGKDVFPSQNVKMLVTWRMDIDSNQGKNE